MADSAEESESCLFIPVRVPWEPNCSSLLADDQLWKMIGSMKERDLASLFGPSRSKKPYASRDRSRGCQLVFSKGKGGDYT